LTANLSGATISVSVGVANVTIDYGAAPLAQLANAVYAKVLTMGANTVVIDTDVVVDSGIANSLAARAASREGFMGGALQSVGTPFAPRFIITIPVKR